MKRSTICISISLALSLGLLLVLLWLLGSEIGLSIFAAHAAEFASNADTSIWDGLVAYYPFNGNANDESGNGNHGTVEGATLTTDRFGSPSSAYSFDASLFGLDDYIEMQSPLTLSEFSFSLWVKTQMSGSINNAIIYTIDDGVGHYYALQGNSAGALSIVVDGDEVNEFDWAFEADAWTHIVVTFDGLNAQLYKDGVLTEAGAISGSPITGTLTIGDPQSTWNGEIDDIRIYNCVLSETGIQALYYEGAGLMVLVPTTQLGYDGPGESVVYEERLINATGQTDSFDLSLLPGSAWTTTLSLTNTGPLSDGAWISFTLQVTIPTTASPGDKDTAAIRATSVASPTVYSDTATIQTFVPVKWWYVSPGGSDGNDCQTPATPCATIDGPLGKPAFLVDATVLVATGTYTGTGDDVVLLDKNVRLLGGRNDTFTAQSGVSTIDGEGSRRGMTVSTDVTATVELFVVQNGASNDYGGGIKNGGVIVLTNSTVQNGSAEFGGGIYNGGVMTLTNSIVSGNTAEERGGGVYGTSGSSTIIVDTQIYGNTATNDEGSGEGGGINGGVITLINSTVNGNTADNDGGGVCCGDEIVIVDTQIYGNTATNGEGGGINASGHLSLSRSWVVANAAPDNDSGGIYGGGAVYIENSIIAGNTSNSSGGGLRLGGDGLHRIVNSHVVGNEAGGEGAALVAGGGAQIELTNTLVISNTGNTGIWGYSDPVFLLNYCDTYGNSPDGTVGVIISRTNCLA